MPLLVAIIIHPLEIMTQMCVTDVSFNARKPKKNSTGQQDRIPPEKFINARRSSFCLSISPGISVHFST